MQTRKALKLLSNGDKAYAGQSNGLLEKRARQLVDMYNAREREILEKQRAASVPAPFLETIKKKVAKVIDAPNPSMPIVTKFDLYTGVRRIASRTPSDSGLKKLSAHLERAWHAEPLGTLTYKDVNSLVGFYKDQYPRSKAASVIEAECTKSGLHKLPVAKLARIASAIKSQDDYETAMVAHGLAGSRPEQVRARALVRDLVGMRTSEANSKKAPRDTRTAEQRITEGLVSKISATKKIAAPPGMPQNNYTNTLSDLQIIGGMVDRIVQTLDKAQENLTTDGLNSSAKGINGLIKDLTKWKQSFDSVSASVNPMSEGEIAQLANGENVRGLRGPASGVMNKMKNLLNRNKNDGGEKINPDPSAWGGMLDGQQPRLPSSENNMSLAEKEKALADSGAESLKRIEDGRGAPAAPGPAAPGPAAPGPATPGPATPDPATPDPAQPDPAQPGPAQPGPAQGGVEVVSFPPPAPAGQKAVRPMKPGPATPGPATPGPARPPAQVQSAQPPDPMYSELAEKVRSSNEFKSYVQVKDKIFNIWEDALNATKYSDDLESKLAVLPNFIEDARSKLNSLKSSFKDSLQGQDPSVVEYVSGSMLADDYLDGMLEQAASKVNELKGSSGDEAQSQPAAATGLVAEPNAQQSGLDTEPLPAPPQSGIKPIVAPGGKKPSELNRQDGQNNLGSGVGPLDDAAQSNKVGPVSQDGPEQPVDANGSKAGPAGETRTNIDELEQLDDSLVQELPSPDKVSSTPKTITDLIYEQMANTPPGKRIKLPAEFGTSRGLDSQKPIGPNVNEMQPVLEKLRDVIRYPGKFDNNQLKQLRDLAQSTLSKSTVGVSGYDDAKPSHDRSRDELSRLIKEIDRRTKPGRNRKVIEDAKSADPSEAITYDLPSTDQDVKRKSRPVDKLIQMFNR